LAYARGYNPDREAGDFPICAPVTISRLRSYAQLGLLLTFLVARSPSPLKAQAIGDHNRRISGSPYVELDSWIYPALERAAALGYMAMEVLGMRPWTRIECATLVVQVGKQITARKVNPPEISGLYDALSKEFQPDLDAAEGESREAIHLESLYATTTGIAGQPLNDSYHFGQTIINNYGRPYQGGFNSADGFSGWATAGRFVLYVRGEFQHSAAAPAYSLAVRQAIATVDQNPTQPATPFRAVSRFALLDTYAAANLAGWDLAFGKQSLWWGPGEGGALLFSNNAAPIYMARASRVMPFTLPWIFHWIGPMKVDTFFGKLSGNEFPSGPLIHGVKVSFKPTPIFELGISSTSEFGGAGRPITAAAIWNSYFSSSSSSDYGANANPGKRSIGIDFSYKIPFVGMTLYDDVLLPMDNPTNFDTSTSPLHDFQRAAMRPGIYMPRLPRFHKLDFRTEAVYTNPPTPRSVGGQYIYWNDYYHDLYTNEGNLIADWIGREGMGFQSWSTYWITARSSLQFGYRHSKVPADFIPGGETLNDGSVKLNWGAPHGLNLSLFVQYEKWFAPLLAPTPRSNWTANMQISFLPDGLSFPLRSRARPTATQ
jgi:hypothetical protein